VSIYFKHFAHPRNNETNVSRAKACHLNAGEKNEDRDMRARARDINRPLDRSRGFPERCYASRAKQDERESTIYALTR